MRSPPFSLFALNGFFRTGLRSLLVDLFRLTSRHDDVRNLPTFCSVTSGSTNAATPIGRSCYCRPQE
jgi:hypothetical protein